MATSVQQPKRTRRPFFFDPRFAIGLGLVIASVVGVYAIVRTADHTTQVYAARNPLVAGQHFNADDLVVRSVQLGSIDGKYLAADGLPDDGAVAKRSVPEGELVPASAIGTAAAENETSVVVRVKGDVAASVTSGTSVDVWSAARTEHDRYDPPAVLVDGATVVRVVEADGMVASSDGLSVEVRVPKKKVAAVLEAIANADAISLVPDTSGAEASGDAAEQSGK
jgi:SAF domain-containing protein